MKKLIIIIYLIFPFILFGQLQGKLFIHSGFVSNNELGYIQYPQNQYYTIDNSNPDDMIICGDKLIISNDKIYFYDINTLSRIDSILTIYATKLAFENNKLAVIKSEPPYFEVYNISTKNLIFSLDTNKIKLQAVDLLIDMGKAYLLFDTTLSIVDLNMPDSIKNFTTHYPFPFGAYNQNLCKKDNKIYIDVEYATGAPRFSLLSYNKNTNQIETVFHGDFIDTPYEPVVAENKIYMSVFPSHYNITNDTFIYIPNANNTYPLTYDNFSNTIFLYKPFSLMVNYLHNDTLGNDVIIPTYINKSVYYNEANTGIASNNDEMEILNIFPNPAKDYINIKMNIALESEAVFEMYDNSGILSVSDIINIGSNNKLIDIKNLKAGLYFYNIFNQYKKIASGKLTVIR